MAKITLYLSKAKKEEIEKWRKKFNFSRMFQEELDRVIARLERK